MIDYLSNIASKSSATFRVDHLKPFEINHTSKSVYAGILISSNIYGCFWSLGQSESR